MTGCGKERAECSRAQGPGSPALKCSQELTPVLLLFSVSVSCFFFLFLVLLLPNRVLLWKMPVELHNVLNNVVAWLAALEEVPYLIVKGRQFEHQQWVFSSSSLGWKIPWTEEPGRLWSIGSQESDTTEAAQWQQQRWFCRTTLQVALLWEILAYVL